ncbi:MAG: T9SS type A sorting domain-containing protein [Ferruginibacter sp.]|nr:T9SS type A sorting domain-containing protein [Cytophagales bacterium]
MTSRNSGQFGQLAAAGAAGRVEVGRIRAVRGGLPAAVAWLLSFLVQSAWAQLVEVPVRGGERPSGPGVSPASARVTALTPLKLPFFDDFASAAIRQRPQPDTARWLAEGGAYINNELPVNHPTLYVATLDGLKANGAAYDVSSPLSQGPTDTLLSRPIDLSAYATVDSLYLSFFWQARGLGEQPDLNDSLILQFKDNGVTENWRTVWKQLGQFNNGAGGITNAANTIFVQALVPVQAAAFFHPNFQFRFRAFGRRAGAFDVWHLDYLYLDRGRSLVSPYPGRPNPPDRFPKDLAARQAVSSFLKRYTAMPVRQYFHNPAQSTAPAVSTEINNLFNNPSFTRFSVRVEDTLSKQVFQSCDLPPQQNQVPCNQPPVGINSLSSQLKTFAPLPLPAPAATKPLVVRSTFDFEINGESLPDVDVRANNRIAGYTTLDNYYAYDDGTAEYAAGINQKQGQVAVQYVVNQPDTLAAIRLYITQYNVSLQNQPFVLQVWGNRNGRPFGKPYEESFLVNYANSLNQFNEYVLKQSVTVTDTFYVGWKQISDDLFPVGLDKNTEARNYLFFNLGSGEWLSNAEQVRPVTGSVMIRPVMGKATAPVITGTEPGPLPTEPDFRVYPNPTDGPLTWNDARFRRARVYDPAGRLLLTRDVTSPDTPALDLRWLPNGLYLLHLSDGQRTVVRKVVVAR